MRSGGQSCPVNPITDYELLECGFTYLFQQVEFCRLYVGTLLYESESQIGSGDVITHIVTG